MGDEKEPKKEDIKKEEEETEKGKHIQCEEQKDCMRESGDKHDAIAKGSCEKEEHNEIKGENGAEMERTQTKAAAECKHVKEIHGTQPEGWDNLVKEENVVSEEHNFQNEVEIEGEAKSKKQNMEE